MAAEDKATIPEWAILVQLSWIFGLSVRFRVRTLEMITITEDGIQGVPLEHLGYVKKRGYLGQMVLPVTRWLRAVNAEKYMGPGKRHLDIGCGDGYFLKRSKCTERCGLDKLLGD